jgi:hypothetical protein
MQLTLSPEEARELREVLATVLADLHTEIHYTDSAEFREHLLNRQRLLLRLREELSAGEVQP